MDHFRHLHTFGEPRRLCIPRRKDAIDAHSHLVVNAVVVVDINSDNLVPWSVYQSWYRHALKVTHQFVASLKPERLRDLLLLAQTRAIKVGPVDASAVLNEDLPSCKVESSWSSKQLTCRYLLPVFRAPDFCVRATEHHGVISSVGFDRSYAGAHHPPNSNALLAADIKLSDEVIGVLVGRIEMQGGIHG